MTQLKHNRFRESVITTSLKCSIHSTGVSDGESILFMNARFQGTKKGIPMKFYVFQNEMIPDLCRESINTNVIYGTQNCEAWHAAASAGALLKTAIKPTCCDATRPSEDGRQTHKVRKLPFICDFQKSVSLPCTPHQRKLNGTKQICQEKKKNEF